MFLPLSQLAPRPCTWLWPNRLPLGKLVILDGDPGLGKSLIALDLCARLSTGRAFPDGAPGHGPAASIILSAEDGASDTIRPRLAALGADLDRIFVPTPHDLDGRHPLLLPRSIHRLAVALEQTAAALLVIDPIMAFLDRTIVSMSDQSVRRALRPLAELADAHRCTVLLIRHLNKFANHRSLYRGGGSIGIVGASRAAWLAARDPHAPDRCVLAQVKNNLAAPQPSLAYSVRQPPSTQSVERLVLPPTQNSEFKTQNSLPLTWLGPSPWIADQLLQEAARHSGASSKRFRARLFLKNALANGPRATRDFWPLARDQALSQATLHRARRELEIRTVPVTVDGRLLHYWLLPNQSLPDSLAPNQTDLDLDPWLAPLRDQFPTPTPLDPN